MQRVFIVGGFCTDFIGKYHPAFIWKKHPDFGKRSNPTLESYIRDAVIEGLGQAGAAAAAVDRAYIGNFAGELFENQGHLGAMVASVDPDLDGKPIYRVEGACASGGLAFHAAYESVRAGFSHVALGVGAETQNTKSAKEGADYLARASHYATQRNIDPIFTFPCMFARRMKENIDSGRLSMTDCARVAVKAYRNANMNPKAHMKARKMTLEMASSSGDDNPTFLGNPDYTDYLRISDCSQVSDGGAGVVLCSEEGLKRIGKKMSDCIEVLSSVISTSSLRATTNALALDTVAACAKLAYTEAKVEPDDVHVAEVHDCFTVAELLMYEALGFAEEGKAPSLIESGETEIDGRIPVNTGGGLCGFGHPVGATGIKQVVELYKQFKGLSGSYQLSRIPQVGIAANMGGDDRTAVVSIFRNVD